MSGPDTTRENHHLSKLPARETGVGRKLPDYMVQPPDGGSAPTFQFCMNSLSTLRSLRPFSGPCDTASTLCFGTYSSEANARPADGGSKNFSSVKGATVDHARDSPAEIGRRPRFVRIRAVGAWPCFRAVSAARARGPCCVSPSVLARRRERLWREAVPELDQTLPLKEVEQLLKHKPGVCTPDTGHILSHLI